MKFISNVVLFLFIFISLLNAFEKLEVHFIDVGQGDSILILSPNEKTILIDGGPVGSALTLKKYLESLKVSSIDLVILTHAHADHIGGLKTIFENFTIKNFLDSGFPHTSELYKSFLTYIKDNNIPYKLAKKGKNIIIDKERGIELTILSPPEDSFIKSSLSDVNANSVVTKLTYRKISFLFTGDAEPETEKFLLEEREGLQSTILKVAHHGSETSTIDKFLDAVSPKIVLITAGNGNIYGHPHKRTLEKLEKRGIEIFRTDLNGTLIIRTDGNSLEKETILSEKKVKKKKKVKLKIEDTTE